MTSISAARPRPPPIATGVDLGAGLPNVHQTQSGGQAERIVPRKELEDDEVEFVDSRPAKRRKLSIGESSGLDVADAVNTPVVPGQQVTAKYSPVSWSAIASSRPSARPGIKPLSTDSLPPLPGRPWAVQKAREIPTDQNRLKSRVRLNNVVPNTPDSMQTPLAAPLLNDGRRADYFPWTGKHPEDNINETTVKTGYFDRAPNPIEKELNTAKAPLYNAFKHRAGLESLSALFSLVLSQRSSKGALSSISSFKGPPPRVTLTEIKRKSWISDLANLTVPLKRLSKTIPQGIRGQLLLEQCLQHSVPLSRAIWFAKCVGANEIRTLKRKGINPVIAQGAEAKWLREWTIHIEQFVEQTLLNCGQAEWKVNARYVLNLSTRLYAENLLDRDHYLEWMVKSLSASNHNQAPMWLMVAHLHKADLLASRKRGKHFAEILVAKVNSMQNQMPDIFEPLAQRYRKLLQESVKAVPMCCLMPAQWNECSQALSLALDTNDTGQRALLNRLRVRNEQARGQCRSMSTSDVPSDERIIDILDSAHSPFDVRSLADTLLGTSPDAKAVVMTCMAWCVSRYRTRPSRIYLAVRLLRRWYKDGVDVDGIFLDLIQDRMCLHSIDRSALQHLAFELSRSHTFSVSKYLQWLTVRGLPRPGTFSTADLVICTAPEGTDVKTQSCHDDSQLLTECCLSGQRDHVRNLRNSLLEKGGYDLSNELFVVEQCQRYIDRIATESESLLQERDRPQFSRLPWSIRAQLARYARTFVAKLVGTSHNQLASTTVQPTASLSLAQLEVMRSVFEQLQDVAMFADVLRSIAFSKEEAVLAFVTDTVNFNSETLSAIGALQPLQTMLCQTYLALRPVKTSMPMFAMALIDLCQQYPVRIAPVHALQHDFIRGDRTRAVAACSPFSDGVAESLQQAGETFHDDFEAILQTESNMSASTFTQLFGVLSHRIEKIQNAERTSEQLQQLCHLVCRLRLCRPSQGDTLLKQWLTGRLMDNMKAALNNTLITNLIAVRCITLKDLLSIHQTPQLPTSSKQMVGHLVCDAVSVTHHASVSGDVWYAVRLAARKCVYEHPVPLLETLVRVEGTQPTKLNPVLIDRVICNTDLAHTLSSPATSAVSKALAQSEVHGDGHSNPLVHSIRSLLKLTSPLTIYRVQFRIKMLCGQATVKADDTLQEQIADVACQCFRDGTSPLCHSARLIQSILNALSPGVSTKIRLKMEQDFFEALPKFMHSRTISHFPLPSNDDTHRASQALRLICAIADDKNASQQGTGMSLLVEKLSIYLKCISSSTMGSSLSSATPGPGTSPSSTSTAPALLLPDTLRAFMLATIDTLQVMMQMVCIKRGVFNPSQSQPSPAVAKQNQHDQIKLVGLVISIATNPAWSVFGPLKATTAHQQKTKDIISFMFDVAATLVDDMTEESRGLCVRLLKDKIKDPRVKWLLGSIKMFGSVQYKDAGAGLELRQEGRGVAEEFRPKVWELLEIGGTQNDACLGLGLFGAKNP